MSSLYDRTIMEQTLFELYNSKAYDETEASLRVALANISDKILKVPDTSEWSKSVLMMLKRLLKMRLKVLMNL
jgi:hypothetical protein